MKFTITMKDPDGVYESISEAVKLSESESLLSKDEREELYHTRRNELDEVIEPWFKWSEYLTVEIDTETKTCVVMKVGRR